MCVRRFYALRPGKVKCCEEAELGEPKQLQKRKKVEIRPQLPKLSVRKSSALQNTYGETFRVMKIIFICWISNKEVVDV